MFTPQNPDYQKRVHHSFAQQTITSTLSMSIDEIQPGQISLAMPFAKTHTQQHGFVHAGIITTGLDNACGYAAFSLMADQYEVLTVEFKTSFLAPAQGQRFVFIGKVKKAGRTLTFVEAEAYAMANEQRTLIATMSATMMAVAQRAKRPD